MFSLKNLAGMLAVLLVPALFAITTTSMWGMEQEKLTSQGVVKLLKQYNAKTDGKRLINEWMLGQDIEVPEIFDSLFLNINDDTPEFEAAFSFKTLFRLKAKNINGAICREIQNIVDVKDDKQRSVLISGLTKWFMSKENDKNFNLPDIFQKMSWLFFYGADKSTLYLRSSISVRILIALYDEDHKELAKRIFAGLEDDTSLTQLDKVKHYTQLWFYSGVLFASADQDTLLATKLVAKKKIKPFIGKIVDICGNNATQALTQCLKDENHVLAPIFRECLEEVINENKSIIEKFLDDQNNKSQNNDVTEENNVQTNSKCLKKIVNENNTLMIKTPVKSSNGNENQSKKQNQPPFVMTSDNIVTLILSGIAGLFAPNFKGATPVLLGLGTVAGGYSATNVDKKWAWPTICAGTAFVANVCRHYVVPMLFYGKTSGNKNRIKMPKNIKPFNENSANNSF